MDIDDIVFKENALGTFSVGFVDHDGEWITMGKYPTAEIAAEQVLKEKERMRKVLALHFEYWGCQGSA